MSVACLPPEAAWTAAKLLNFFSLFTADTLLKEERGGNPLSCSEGLAAPCWFREQELSGWNRRVPWQSCLFMQWSGINGQASKRGQHHERGMGRVAFREETKHSPDLVLQVCE